MTMLKYIAIVFAALFSFSVSAEPLGFDHHSDGTKTAKYKSDSHNDRCSGMSPKIQSMASNYCVPLSMQAISTVWCDEAKFCPAGLCNHYAYLRFKCVAGADSVKSLDQLNEEEEDVREIVVLE
jgi:hypothetical protein